MSRVNGTCLCSFGLLPSVRREFPEDGVGQLASADGPSAWGSWGGEPHQPRPRGPQGLETRLPCDQINSLWTAGSEGGFGALKLSVAFWGALFGFVGSLSDVTSNSPHMLNPDHKLRTLHRGDPPQSLGKGLCPASWGVRGAVSRVLGLRGVGTACHPDAPPPLSLPSE